MPETFLPPSVFLQEIKRFCQIIALIEKFRFMAGTRMKNSMTDKVRTTIGIKMTTKDKLDKNRAPGQCYDGFICQLVDLWEKVKEGKQDYILNTSRGR